MKTSNRSLDTFAQDAISLNEMNFLRGGGEPSDLVIHPDKEGDDGPVRP